MEQKKRKITRTQIPTIDIGRCSDCRGCIELAPEVFVYNQHLGMMEVVEATFYDCERVDEAIKNCPKKCIVWDCAVMLV